MRRAATLTCAFLAVPLAALAAAPAPEPPVSGAAALVELVECHAYAEERIRETARRLERERVWTSEHQNLMAETRLHDIATARLREAMDDATRRALLATYFPDGIASPSSEADVDRWTRCRRLYLRLRDQNRAIRGG